MKNNILKAVPWVLALPVLSNSANVDSSILKEIKLLKMESEIEKTPKTPVVQQKKEIEVVKATDSEKIKEILGLYFLGEYKSSLYLLNKVKEDNNIKNFKSLLKTLIKIDENKSVTAELDYLLTFPFLDYFIISEIHKNLIVNNRTKDAIYFLKNTKVSPFSFIKGLNLSEKEKKELKLEEYFSNENQTIEKQIKLAKAYERVDMLLDSYETYKENNPNNKYTSQINELRKRINYRIKLYSNYKENTNNVKNIMKKYKNVQLFKMYKEKK